MFALITLPMIVLGILLVCVVWTDSKFHKIPNVLVLAIIVSGIVFQTISSGLHGIVEVIVGLFAGLCIFLPLYILGGMRAGDVKLMSAVGAYLGFYTPLAAASSLLVGGIIGLLIMAYHKKLLVFLGRYYEMIKLSMFAKTSYIPPPPGDPALIQFPYAIAIATGTLIMYILMPEALL